MRWLEFTMVDGDFVCRDNETDVVLMTFPIVVDFDEAVCVLSGQDHDVMGSPESAIAVICHTNDRGGWSIGLEACDVDPHTEGTQFVSPIDAIELNSFNGGVALALRVPDDLVIESYDNWLDRFIP